MRVVKESLISFASLDCPSVLGGNVGERCLRRQCETSIGCDEGRFISPEECASALTIRFTKESRRVSLRGGAAKLVD